MNRIGERCYRDLKYSNAVDEDAPSNAAISTTAKSAADEQIYVAAEIAADEQIYTAAKSAAKNAAGEQIYAATKNDVGEQIYAAANYIVKRMDRCCCEECC